MAFQGCRFRLNHIRDFAINVSLLELVDAAPGDDLQRMTLRLHVVMTEALMRYPAALQQLPISAAL